MTQRQVDQRAIRKSPELSSSDESDDSSEIRRLQRLRYRQTLPQPSLESPRSIPDSPDSPVPSDNEYFPPIPFAPRPNYAPSSYAVVTKSVDENNEQMRRCLEQLSIGLEEQRSRSSLNLDLQQQNSQLRNQMQVMLEEKTNLERRLNNFKYELLQCQEELQRMKVENDRLTKFDKIVHAAIGMKRQRTE